MAAVVKPLAPVVLELDLYVDDAKEFSTVILTTVINGQEAQLLGSAKRNRGDKYNEEVGRTLALARALRELATEVEAMAHEADGSH